MRKYCGQTEYAQRTSCGQKRRSTRLEKTTALWLWMIVGFIHELYQPIAVNFTQSFQKLCLCFFTFVHILHSPYYDYYNFNNKVEVVI